LRWRFASRHGLQRFGSFWYPSDWCSSCSATVYVKSWLHSMHFSVLSANVDMPESLSVDDHRRAERPDAGAGVRIPIPRTQKQPNLFLSMDRYPDYTSRVRAARAIIG
jgi:hypothetical protein